ncbi:hypothetical protein AB0H34_26475 [Saccharopolyspora shandongensis]|uniref:hypothetical protein n=1 Tax=Saccharopolyspora shandongensis TaxID=418495 RepID=UPI0033FEC32A
MINLLCMKLQAPKRGLASMCSRLDKEGYPVTVSTLSRYRNGKSVPPEGFVRALHGAVTVDTCDQVDISLEQLTTLCRSARNSSKRPRPLKLDADHGFQGDDSVSAAKILATPLPVETLRAYFADRQRIMRQQASTRSNVAADAKREAVDAAVTLSRSGRDDDALTLLRELPGVLGPATTGASIVKLRQYGEHALAETLIGTFSRERSDREVLRFSLALNYFGLVADATKAMSIALTFPPA